jgi:hypothetical protein
MEKVKVVARCSGVRVLKDLTQDFPPAEEPF